MADFKSNRLHKVKSVPLFSRFSGWINSKKGSKGSFDKSFRNYAEGPSTQKSTSSPPDDLLPGDLPRNILAFRTIMKLLHNIQDRDFKITQSEESYKKLRSAEVAELKISNAFATVAVTTHQVIAVATNQRIHPKTLKVVASIQSFDDNHYTAPPPHHRRLHSVLVLTLLLLPPLHTSLCARLIASTRPHFLLITPPPCNIRCVIRPC